MRQGHTSQGSEARALETSSRLGRHSSLDGLRGLAVLFVMAFHGFWLPGGYLGVDVFFVLSGFLITSLLLDEWMSSGTVSLRHFYVRRGLRLFPCLGGMLAFYVLHLGYVSHGSFNSPGIQRNLSQVGLALVGLANLDGVLGRVPAALTHLWTLAIEQQFYVAWPLVLFFVLSRWGKRPALIVALLVAALCVVGEATLGVSTSLDSTYARAVGLPLGCALALARHVVPFTRPDLRKGRLIVLIAAPIGLYVLITGQAITPIFARFVSPLVTLSTAALIAVMVATPGDFLARGLSFRPMAAIGRISYGIYVWHVPVMILTVYATHQLVPFPPLGVPSFCFVAGSILAAAISYRYLERPFLRLKDRYGHPGRTQPMMTAKLRALDVTLPTGLASQRSVEGGRTSAKGWT